MAEVLVAVLLGVLVVHLGLTALVVGRRVEAWTLGRADAVVTLRTARTVLGHDLRVGARDADWWPSGDTVALRAFRAQGRVCAGSSTPDQLVVAAEGLRRPDPVRDSAHVLLLDGSWLVRDLVDAASSAEPCGSEPSVLVERWSVEPPLPAPAVFVRAFESGSYHVANDALRYRRGGGGRQPLTPTALATPPSRFESHGGGVRLVLVGAGGAWRWAGSFPGGPRAPSH